MSTGAVKKEESKKDYFPSLFR